MSEGVLAGIRVLHFGRFIAGPFCGAVLADRGADVIRIDKLGGSAITICCTMLHKLVTVREMM